MRYKILLKRLQMIAPLWVILMLTFLVILCLRGYFILYTDALQDWYSAQKWDNLPLLPDGETALEITEIYVNREIHVTTDQGHYYGCTYLNEKNCWFPIPREINHYASRLPWTFGKRYPQVPTGARQLVVETFDRHEDSGNITFAAIIYADGQVAFWDNNDSNYGLPYSDGCCGLLFIFPVIGVLLFLKRLRHVQLEQ